jgi:RNA polymerase-binding protein DksA
VAQKRKKASKKAKNPTRTKARRLSAADINHFKEMLLEKRREILVNVNEMEDEALKKSRLDASGDLSSMPIHMADIGTDNYEQEFALGLMDSERKLLKEIDDALQRIEKRTYGTCEGTGKPISKARLEAQPWARYCVEYARMLEQGLVAEQEQPIPRPQEYEGKDEP